MAESMSLMHYLACTCCWADCDCGCALDCIVDRERVKADLTEKQRMVEEYYKTPGAWLSEPDPADWQ